MEITSSNVANILLEGAAFCSFSFGCNFSLSFECKRREDVNLPFSICLSIEGDWWFGDENEWKRTVSEMTANRNCIEPEEPVLAFQLAALRWSSGSTISHVNLSADKLEIQFASGQCITILNQICDEGECAWEIIECSYDNELSGDYWWVSCDRNGSINYNIPSTYNQLI